MKRHIAFAFGILVLTIFAFVVTEATLAVGRQTAVSPVGQQSSSSSPSPKPSATPSPSDTPSPSVAATPSATPTPTPSPVAQTATTNGFVHFRASDSTGSTDLANLQAGTVVQLRGSAIGAWQPVAYDGENGYIYTSYLTY